MSHERDASGVGTVTNTYPIVDHFRYVTIAPINLIAGDLYEVAGVSNVDNYTWADPGFTVNSAISILSTSGQEPRWESLNTPSFLTGSGYLDQVGNDGYWGPNVFLGSASFATPEPSTWAMMGLRLRRPRLRRLPRAQERRGRGVKEYHLKERPPGGGLSSSAARPILPP